MARKLKIMENEKHPLDDLKNDEITIKREKCEMHSERPNKQLKESDAGIYTQSMDRSNTQSMDRSSLPLLNQGRLKESEEKCDPVGGPAVSINLHFP